MNPLRLLLLRDTQILDLLQALTLEFKAQLFPVSRSIKSRTSRTRREMQIKKRKTSDMSPVRRIKDVRNANNHFRVENDKKKR